MKRHKLFYKALISAVVAFTIGAISLVEIVPAKAQTFNNGGAGCSVAGAFAFNNAFSVNGRTATTVVKVNGPASCRETVSLSSWNAGPGRSGFVGQQFFAGKTFFNLPPGNHALSIGINNTCTFQVDLLLGRNVTSGSGNAMFSPAVLMGFTQVRGAACPAATAQAPTTPTPTPAPAAAQPAQVSVCNGSTSNSNSGTAAQGGNCSTNTVVVQNSSGSGGSGSGASQSASVAASSSTATSGSSANTNESANVVAAQSAGSSATPESTSSTETSAATTEAAPSSLVNTGPASATEIVGLFVAATVAGALAYTFMKRRSLTRTP